MLSNPVQHPTDQALSAFGLGTIDAKLRAPIEAHVSSCDTCRRRVADLSGSKPGSGTSGAFASSVMEGRSGQTPAAKPADDALPPELANHPDYEVLRELGRGGMGVVYLAENRLMGRKEVLKIVGEHLVKKKGVFDRFLREIRAAAQLRHTNIVTAYTASRLGEGVVFSMEYVEGYDLSKLVERKGPLDVPLACNFIYQAAQGLQHAFERGMVHRDVKPSNLMVAREGKRPVIKILDFGLAKVTSETGVDGGLTNEGQMLGTPHYVAPEQILDAQKADIRADIYSLGCTLYCLLTGRPPFEANSLYELLQAHHTVDSRPLDAIRPDVPAGLAALAAKMLAKDPARRFQTPGEVASALAPYFRSGATPPSGEVRVSPATSAPSGSRPPLDGTMLDAGPPPKVRPAPTSPASGSRPPFAATMLEVDVAPPPQFQAEPEPEAGRTPWLPITIAASALLAVGLPAAWLLSRPGNPPAQSPPALAAKPPGPRPAPPAPSAPVAPAKPADDLAEADDEAEDKPGRRGDAVPKKGRGARSFESGREALSSRSVPGEAPGRDMSPGDAIAPAAASTPPAREALVAMGPGVPDPAEPRPAEPAVATPATPAAPPITGPVEFDDVLADPKRYEGQEFDLADVFLTATSTFVRNAKIPGGIGIRLKRKDGWNVSDGNGKIQNSGLVMIVHPETARRLERALEGLKIKRGPVARSSTLLRTRIEPKGESLAFVLVDIEMLAGYDSYKIYDGAFDEAFTTLGASPTDSRAGYGDGRKWVERLGGDKFISDVRRRVKDARSRKAADARQQQFNDAFQKVADQSQRAIQESDREFMDAIRRMRGR